MIKIIKFAVVILVYVLMTTSVFAQTVSEDSISLVKISKKLDNLYFGHKKYSDTMDVVLKQIEDELMTGLKTFNSNIRLRDLDLKMKALVGAQPNFSGEIDYSISEIRKIISSKNNSNLFIINTTALLKDKINKISIYFIETTTQHLKMIENNKNLLMVINSLK